MKPMHHLSNPEPAHPAMFDTLWGEGGLNSSSIRESPPCQLSATSRLQDKEAVRTHGLCTGYLWEVPIIPQQGCNHRTEKHRAGWTSAGGTQMVTSPKSS